MRFLLDSNIFIQAMVKDDRHLKRQIRIHLSQIAMSTIVQYELYSGSHHSRRRREQIEGIEELALPLLPFNSATRAPPARSGPASSARERRLDRMTC